MNRDQIHICFVLTTPFALNAFVAPAIRALLAQGFTVTVVLNTRLGVIQQDIANSIEVIDLDIARAISPFHDLRALWVLTRLFWSKQFDIVHSVTPKAGLLAMIAARMSGITVRVHTFTGQVWATRRGPTRWLLRGLDQLLAACATALLTDSASQRDYLVAEKVVRRPRLHLLGKGSITGVDATRFRPHPSWRQDVRAALGISSDAVLLLYVGRMHFEKGITELAQSFLEVVSQFPNTHLLLVGPDEGALKPALESLATCIDRVHAPGLTSEPEKYMAASDIFCLASYREGFGLSLIEAAAAGLPCVASRIYGLTDAVVENVTGLMVPVRDVHAFSQALAVLVKQPIVRQNMGEAARRRVEKDFSQAMLVQAWLDFYQRQIAYVAVQR